MQEPYWWYVLYTRTNAEKRVTDGLCEAFNKHTDGFELQPFCPESEYYYRGDGKRLGKVYRKRPLFPGYVFVETNMPQNEFLKRFSSFIYDSPDIVRLLHYGDSRNIALSDGERKRFEFLFRGRRCLDHSEGYIIGDKVFITVGPLIGMEGSITHINRHNKMAELNVDMFGGKTKIKVALEIVEKK